MNSKLILQSQKIILRNYAQKVFYKELEIKKRLYLKIMKISLGFLTFNLIISYSYRFWHYIDYDIDLTNPKLTKYHKKRLG